LIFLSSSPYVHPWWPDKLSRWYSTSCQVFCSITGETDSQAAVIQQSSLSLYCTFVWYTKSCLYLHRKKSKVVKTGDLGGHAIGPPSPNPSAWKLLFQKGFHCVSIMQRGSTLQEDASSWYPCDCPSTLCHASKSLSQSAVSRQTDLERASYHTAPLVTRFDPLDFFLWGYMKDSVYQMKVHVDVLFCIFQ
jgi:hypothetical protein